MKPGDLVKGTYGVTSIGKVRFQLGEIEWIDELGAAVRIIEGEECAIGKVLSCFEDEIKVVKEK
jgi:hypothetical protein